mgnify:FL=1
MKAISKPFAKLSAKLKRRNINIMDLLMKLLAGFGVSMILCEVNAVFFKYIRSADNSFYLGLFMLTLLATFGGFMFGFLLQGLLFFITGNTRRNEYSWEDTTHYFKFGAALPMLIVCVVTGFAFFGLFDAYCRELMMRGILWQYDGYSLFPIMMSCSWLISSVLGVYLQFFPYNRIVTFERIGFCTAVSLFCVLISSGYPLVSIFFAVYAISAIIIMNQSHIVRTYHTVTVMRINTSTRLYNMRITLLVLLLATLGGAGVYICVQGLYFLIRLIIYFAIFSIMRLGEFSSTSPEQAVQDMNNSVFGNDPDMNIFYLFGFIVIAGVFLTLLVAARYGIIQSFLAAINRWFRQFIAFFMGGDEEYSESEEINFRDVVTRISDKKTPNKNGFRMPEKLTQREFERRLASMSDHNERLSYAYFIMLNLMSSLAPTLKKSDTPRELAVKINSSVSNDYIDEATELIELIKYAETSSDPNEANSVVARISAFIGRQLT